MLEITVLATEKLSQYIADNNVDSPVRIAMMQGCAGPALGLALDEQKDNDSVMDKDSFKLIVDHDLNEVCGTIKIDFIEPTESGCGCGGGGGFALTTENPLPGAGEAGCGGSCSSGCGC